jgi:hypothetical protein
VLALEPASAAEDGLGIGGGGAAAGVVAGDEAVGPTVAKGSPAGADGDVGDAEFDSDSGQRLAAGVSFDDVLSRGEREGAGHGMSPQGPIGPSGEGIIAWPDFWVKLRVASGGIT